MPGAKREPRREEIWEVENPHRGKPCVVFVAPGYAVVSVFSVLSIRRVRYDGHTGLFVPQLFQCLRWGGARPWHGTAVVRTNSRDQGPRWSWTMAVQGGGWEGLPKRRRAMIEKSKIATTKIDGPTCMRNDHRKALATDDEANRQNPGRQMHSPGSGGR